MKINLSKLCCMNPNCDCHKKFGHGNIVKHSFLTTNHGKKRRLLCKICRRTFSSLKGTVSYRLQKSKKNFDEVVHLSVEGVNKSAIARVKNISRNTVASWLMKASKIASKFQDKNLKGFELKELQFDEIKTFLNGKKDEKWVFMHKLLKQSERIKFLPLTGDMS